MSTGKWWNRNRDGDESPEDPEIRALVERAGRLPEEAEPGRDLFAGIANRIRDAETSPVASPAVGGWRSLFPRPVAAAAVAASLVVVSVFATLQMAAPTGPPSDAEAAVIARSLRERDGVADVHAKVLALIDANRAALPPETVAVIEQNLVSIDRAIAEIHLAIEAHPDAQGLNFLLAEAYRREAELLERLEFFTTENEVGKEVRS